MSKAEQVIDVGCYFLTWQGLLILEAVLFQLSVSLEQTPAKAGISFYYLM